jgi:hypothetical protein
MLSGLQNLVLYHEIWQNVEEEPTLQLVWVSSPPLGPYPLEDSFGMSAVIVTFLLFKNSGVHTPMFIMLRRQGRVEPP